MEPFVQFRRSGAAIEGKAESLLLPQIKRAHRQKVLKHHPDKRKHAGEEVNKLFWCYYKIQILFYDPFTISVLSGMYMDLKYVSEFLDFNGG
jgi:hypothetical protein